MKDEPEGRKTWQSNVAAEEGRICLKDASLVPFLAKETSEEKPRYMEAKPMEAAAC